MNKYVVLLPVLLLACAEPSTNNLYSIEEVDGVRHVHIMQEALNRTPNIDLKLTQTIGGLDEEDAEKMLFNVKDILVDREGNRYVADAGNRRIQKFNRDGRYLLTIGTEGRGPGEFLNVGVLAFNSSNNLLALALNKQKFMEFTRDGEFLREFNIEGMPRLSEVQFSHMGTIIIGNMSGQFIPFPDNTFVFNTRKGNSLLIKVNESSEIIKEIGEKVSETGEVASGDRRVWGFDHNSFTFTTDNDGNFYLAFQYQNILEKYSPDGNLLMRINKPINFQLADAATNERVPVKSHNYLNGKQRDFNFVIPNGGTMFGEIALDSKDRIWVEAFYEIPDYADINSRGKHSHFEVYNPEGVLLGAVPLPRAFDKMRIFDDTLFLIDSRNEMAVFEYSIVEK